MSCCLGHKRVSGWVSTPTDSGICPTGAVPLSNYNCISMQVMIRKKQTVTSEADGAAISMVWEGEVHTRKCQYPLPKAEDIFSTLNGGKKFTKLDLSQAYLQLPIDVESQQLSTINTHKGLFQYTRLPYSIASAPAIFQMTMDKILQGLKGVSCYLDDILITGCDDAEHLANLKNVLQRLQKYGVKLKKNKCSFMSTSVEYLGYKIDATGLHTTQKKIEAIQQAPNPENIQQLRSFLGLVHYYGKFIPNLRPSLNHSTSCCTKILPGHRAKPVILRLSI